VAETDGTPRFRKSKPPKAAHGSGHGGGNGRNASNRNTRPNGKARKRATLNATLPTGAALDEKPEEREAPPVEAETVRTDVIKTMPTVIRTEPLVDGEGHGQGQGHGTEARAEVLAEPASEVLVDTHVGPDSGDSSGSRPRLQRGPNPAMLRSKRPLLASTLRMELTVHTNEGSEPQFSVRPSPSWSNGSDEDTQSVSEAHGGTTFVDEHDGVKTLQEGAPRSRKPTAPGGFASTLQNIPVRSTHRGEHADEARGGGAQQANSDQPQPVLGETVRRGSDIDSNPNLNTPRPRRARRPGERTLIMTRRDKKRSSKRDWMFVVMLVAALGLTASMFLSRQAPADEVVDTSAYDDTQAQSDDEQQPDTFATRLAPYKAKPAPADKPTSGAPAQTGQSAQTESSISASSIQATELRSLPSGAEVVAGDAVVGSTPVRVARGSMEMTYTLRMPGHTPKVVRVGPQSPPSIMVELTRIVSGVPASAGLSHFGTEPGHSPPEPPADVPPAAASVKP
jgi:hypothetical protein